MAKAGACLTILAVVLNQGCSCPQSLPEFKNQAVSTGKTAAVLSNTAVQAIVPSYRFNCSGNVTAWGAYVYPSLSPTGLPQHYYLEFQVWRPSVVDNRCYAWIGTNVLPEAVVSEDGQVTMAVQEGNEVYAETGDVVGFFIEPLGGQGGVQLDTTDTSGATTVWYKDGELIATDPGMCRLSLGAGRMLEFSMAAAPVLTAVVGSTNTELTLAPTATTTNTLPTLSLTTAVRGQWTSTMTAQSPDTQSTIHTTLTPLYMTPSFTHPTFSPSTLSSSSPSPSASSSSFSKPNSNILSTVPLSEPLTLLQPEPTSTTSLVYHIPDEGSAPPIIPTYGVVLGVLGGILAGLLLLIVIIGACIYRSKRKRGQTTAMERPQPMDSTEANYGASTSNSMDTNGAGQAGGDHKVKTILISSQPPIDAYSASKGGVPDDSNGKTSSGNVGPNNLQTDCYDTPRSWEGGTKGGYSSPPYNYDTPLPQRTQNNAGSVEQRMKEQNSHRYEIPRNWNSGPVTDTIDKKKDEQINVVLYDIPLGRHKPESTSKYEVPVRNRVLPALPVAHDNAPVTTIDLRNRQYEEPDFSSHAGDYDCVFLDSI